MLKMPIILDCDPGLDDAIAIFIALASPEFDVKGIVTVAGNQTLEKVTRNALQLLEVCASDVPVIRGAALPLVREQVTAGYVHGTSGLKTLVLPEPKTQAKGNAIKFIYDTAVEAKGELVIVAVGPLTNIAHTILVHPDLKEHVKKIVIMGGGHHNGNITPTAEFNIFADPEAARVVFEAGIELVMVGLDVTMADGLSKDEVLSLFTKHNEKTVIIEHILMDMVNSEGPGYKPWAYIHDAMALMVLLYDDLLSGRWCHVDIETKGERTYGKTVVDYYDTHKLPKNAFVTFEVNRERFHQAIQERLRVYEQ